MNEWKHKRAMKKQLKLFWFLNWFVKVHSKWWDQVSICELYRYDALFSSSSSLLLNVLLPLHHLDLLRCLSCSDVNCKHWMDTILSTHKTADRETPLTFWGSQSTYNNQHNLIISLSCSCIRFQQQQKRSKEAETKERWRKRCKRLC